MPKKCLIQRRVDKVQSTSVFQVGRSVFVGRGFGCSQGFAVWNNPHGLILAAKGWTGGGAIFFEKKKVGLQSEKGK